jgi:hypothetical protein
LILESINWRFGKKIVSVVTFALSINHIYWVKKDEHLLITKNASLNPCKFYFFLNVQTFLPRGFFTFLVAVAHGAACRQLAALQTLEVPLDGANTADSLIYRHWVTPSPL